MTVTPEPLSSRSFSSLCLVPFGLCLALLALYLAAARTLAGALAFPLDDAWIHQTYARTLAEHGQWAYRPGQPSSGSTAPLWTLLLAPAHLLGLPPEGWAYALGTLALGATVALGAWLSWLLWGDQRLAGWTALALAVEWHGLWGAVSGMEIPLYTALALALLALAVSGRGPRWAWGLVGGALTLTRPEGILLVAAIAAHEGWRARERPGAAVRGLLGIVTGWLLWVVPWALANWQLSGLLLPNTFYAKQQEYRALLATPLPQRVVGLLAQPWLGGQALAGLALPWLPWRRLGAAGWLPLVWALSVVLLYALRLPVTYQHGRYLMPTVPIFVIYGMAALAHVLRRVHVTLRHPLAVGVGTAFLLFALLGASAYGADVALIECEMAATARWVAANSQPGELVAAHDIGRLGYLTAQPLLDFAGLISRETIPILRDEHALLDLADGRGTRYLVTFADWYPWMVQDERLKVRHVTACPATRAAGNLPMTVYELRIR